MEFTNFFRLTEDAWGTFHSENINRSPSAPAADPTFKVFSPSGNLLQSGTCVVFAETHLSHAWKYSVTLDGDFERGGVYVVVVEYIVAGFQFVKNFSFIVT